MSLIRCKHERPGGSLVTFGHAGQEGYREYNFQPVSDGAHVAEVNDIGDVATLLAVTSAYELYGDEAVEASKLADEKHAREVRAAQDAINHAAFSFLDELDLAGLKDYAADEFPAVKIDEMHDEEQVRNYLRGLIKQSKE